tara:strand:- start:53 stop:247 length:195 start_codon:yes stop_codon:yes gene_type:complete
MSKINVSEFPPLKSEKLLEEAAEELSEICDGLLDEDVDIMAIIGILEILKFTIISESFEFSDDE